MRPIKKILVTFLVTLVFISFANDGVAQKDTAGSIFETTVTVTTPTTLVADQHQITLWGIEGVNSLDPAFALNARTTLSNAIGNAPVRCEVKEQSGKDILAQCLNKNELDLGLFMIQQGFASVNRASVFNTVFQDVYIQAEMQAQESNIGIWGGSNSKNADDNASLFKGSAFLIFGFVLFLLVVGIFTFLSIIIMRGFKTVIEAQNDNLDMMAKERRLREKERAIVAVMLASELKANKSKIEAYIVVYDEILRSLKDPGRKPKYQSSGDIIQTQPALNRSVFERNTDKLYVLGRDLSSQLIHFYARIKTQPEYINLEPETPLPEAMETVESAVDKAKKLNVIVDHLLDDFDNSGFIDGDEVITPEAKEDEQEETIEMEIE